MEHWTKVAPVTVGHYWYYGSMYKNSPPEMFLVIVYIDFNNRLVRWARGLGRLQDDDEGMWLNATLPEPPITNY